MKDFQRPFAALLSGAGFVSASYAVAPPGQAAWEVAGEVTWARVLAGQPNFTFRPRWLPSQLVRVQAPERLRVSRRVGLRPGNWSGAPRLRRPAALAALAG